MMRYKDEKEADSHAQVSQQPKTDKHSPFISNMRLMVNIIACLSKLEQSEIWTQISLLKLHHVELKKGEHSVPNLRSPLHLSCRACERSFFFFCIIYLEL